jgi:hypothetical protein
MDFPRDSQPAQSTSGTQGVRLTHIMQPCPTCGRRLRILVQYLGKRVYCTHCQRQFIARDWRGVCSKTADADGDLAQRAERLLARFGNVGHG